MKRFFIIASMAVLAVGCQKTEVQNEVQNQIGFNTVTGKMTRAIVPNGENGKAVYPTTQPFGVYAYGWQNGAPTNTTPAAQEGDSPVPVPVMNNVEISWDEENSKWAATIAQVTDPKYYWPNDPRTTLNFHAYSPAQPKSGNPNTELAPHQELKGTISHDETNGLKLTDYVHSNMYVDFMVADPVLEATYANQTVGSGQNLKSGVVALDFKHKMTQVNFVVKLLDGEQYPNVDFEIQSIVLNKIVSNGTYSYKYVAPTSPETEAIITEGWAAATTPATATYTIYPAKTSPATDATDYSSGAPAITNGSTAVEEIVTLRTDKNRTGLTGTNEYNNPGTSFATTPVTMIPQAWTPVSNADTNKDGVDDAVQSFTITYKISGVGVATETIVKTFAFSSAEDIAPAWAINKKITYTLTIGLKEITFAPSVTNWSDTDASGSFTDDPSNVPAQE